jgi:hypothetical protein
VDKGEGFAGPDVFYVVDLGGLLKYFGEESRDWSTSNSRFGGILENQWLFESGFRITVGASYHGG